MTCDPMTDAGVRERRQRLTDAGFMWLPEITGRKHTIKEFGDWKDRWGTFDPQVSYSGRYGLLLNTAIYLDHLVAIDLDIDQAADVIGVIDVMIDTLGDPVCTRHRANSPRLAALYRTADRDGLYKALKGSDGAIEVLTGSQAKLTAFGVHTDKDTGVQTRLQWEGVPGDVRKDELTLITPEQRDAFLHAAHDWLGDDVIEREGRPRPNGVAGVLLAGDLDELYDAAAFIPNSGPVAWQDWNRVGMALYAGSGGHDLGLAAFIDYTARNPLTAHRDCLKRWQDYIGCPPVAIGAGMIFKLAIQHGYRKPIEKAARDKVKYREQLAALRRMTNSKPSI